MRRHECVYGCILSSGAAHTDSAGIKSDSEESMEKFIAGLAAGAMLGALWVANSNKTRSLVQKGQEELKQRMDAYIDEKLAAMETKKESSAKK